MKEKKHLKINLKQKNKILRKSFKNLYIINKQKIWQKKKEFIVFPVKKVTLKILINWEFMFFKFNK